MCLKCDFLLHVQHLVITCILKWIFEKWYLRIYPCKKVWIFAHFYLKSNSNFEKKFGIWGRFPFADFSSDRRPINSLVITSVIKENMHCNISRVVMHLCSQCEFTCISWPNIQSYSFFTWKWDKNVRRCFSAYAAKCCAVLWLNHKGSKSGSNKFVTKDNAALLWIPYTNFIHEKGFIRGSSNYCPNRFFGGLSKRHISFSITTL